MTGPQKGRRYWFFVVLHGNPNIRVEKKKAIIVCFNAHGRGNWTGETRVPAVINPLDGISAKATTKSAYIVQILDSRPLCKNGVNFIIAQFEITIFQGQLSIEILPSIYLAPHFLLQFFYDRTCKSLPSEVIGVLSSYFSPYGYAVGILFYWERSN